MWEAANRYESNPPNAAWIGIAMRAHLEEWLYCVGFGDDIELRNAYLLKLQDPGFKKFIGSVDDEFWRIEKTAPMANAEAVFAHNNIACLLMRFDLTARMRPHLERIGTRITGGFPWAYFIGGTPMGALSEMRRRAGLPQLKA
jgi:hypothetical protein